MLRNTLAAAATLLLMTGCTVTTSTSTGSLSAENLRYSGTADASGVRSDATFKPGEVVYILFDVKGFKTDDKGQCHVQEDLLVKAPDGSEVLNKKNILDFTGEPKGADSLNLNNDITLPPGAPAGKYSVTISLRDVVSSGTVNQNSGFTIAGDAAAAPAPTETPAVTEEPAATETPAAGATEEPAT
jgi:hypothetical protein